jgi:hypothetical protein
MLGFEVTRTAPARATRIRVVRVPALGIAPEEVRRGWLGVELPLHAPGVRRTNQYGILSSPHSRFLRWVRTRLGLAHPIVGYAVAAGVAVDELAKKKPQAALWFRRNVPELLGTGRLFYFAVEDCETVETEPLSAAALKIEESSGSGGRPGEPPPQD